MINPYELFGLDPQKTTLKDLKKRYYELALMVHPDKTNNPDGSEMHTVYMAYKYCEHEILHTQSKENENPSVDDLEKRFKDFCTSQEEQPPSFRDIIEDVLEMKSFHETFQNTKDGYKASYTGGYGNEMDATSLKESYEPTETVQVSKAFPTSALIKYSDFIKPSCNKTDFFSYEDKDPLENYTKIVKKMCLSDYKEAHSKEEDLEKILPQERTLEELIKEREKMLELIEEKNNNVLLPQILGPYYKPITPVR